MKNEIWKDIKDYEGIYQVSNKGRIKSIGRNTSNICLKTKILKESINQNGYIYYCLYKNGKHKRYKIHRLVAEAFILNPNKYPVVNHKDGNKKNNNVENLEWCSSSYNTKHAYNNNLRKKYIGKFNKLSKPIIQYDSEMIEVKEWENTNLASKELNISRGNIWRSIKKGIKAGGYYWKNIDKEYTND